MTKNISVFPKSSSYRRRTVATCWLHNWKHTFLPEERMLSSDDRSKSSVDRDKLLDSFSECRPSTGLRPLIPMALIARRNLFLDWIFCKMRKMMFFNNSQDFFKKVCPICPTKKNWFWPRPRRAHTFFPPQLTKFPRSGRPERENWAAQIHEQDHSEPVPTSRAFYLRTNWSDRTNGKKPQTSHKMTLKDCSGNKRYTQSQNQIMQIFAHLPQLQHRGSERSFPAGRPQDSSVTLTRVRALRRCSELIFTTFQLLKLVT